MCVCVCTYVYTYIHTYIHTKHRHLATKAEMANFEAAVEGGSQWVYLDNSKLPYDRLYSWCIYVHTYVCTYVCIYIHTYIRMYHTYVCICIYIHAV